MNRPTYARPASSSRPVMNFIDMSDAQPRAIVYHHTQQSTNHNNTQQSNTQQQNNNRNNRPNYRTTGSCCLGRR